MIGSTPPMDPNSKTAGVHVPTAEDLRQVTILTQGDWSRIAAQLERKSREEEKMRAMQEEKKALHQRSKEMVKNWSNTIAVSSSCVISLIIYRVLDQQPNHSFVLVTRHYRLSFC